MTHELQHKYRPRLLKEVIGQEAASKIVSKFLKTNTLPHSLLFIGPSGCGKTTLARILKEKLECSDWDFCEINAADTRGIDTIREIKGRVGLAPANGKCRIWLIDESHKLSNDAQNALLKILEDVPRHVYFFLATTDPQKLIQTIKTRCTPITLNSLSDKDLTALLTSIATKEKAVVSIEVIDKIVEVAEGSARKAVVLLNSVIQLENDEDRLKSIEDPEDKAQAFDLVKQMVYTKRPDWKTASDLIKKLKIANRESFRHFVLACAKTELLKANNNSGRAFVILDIFQKPWYGYEETGLEHACFEVIREISSTK